jgi:hypothetical protein
MKKLFITIAFAGIAQLGMAQAQDEAFKKDVLKVIEMSGATGQVGAAKKQILAMIPAEKQAAFLVEFDASLPSLYDKIAKIYMETYTKEDIKAMMVFYSSPVGKKMSEKSGEITEKSMAAGQEWGTGLQGILMKYMQ